MKIVGLVKTSAIDYPGKLASIVFLYGCNFRCKFCHNPNIVIGKKGEYEEISEESLFAFLEKRKGMLEGVVVTGGEPLINSDIEELCKKIKSLGYLVKMDSNGTNPEMLKNLIEKKLIDYVAMDIKNSPEKYGETVGAKIKINDIKKSIKIIMESGLPYEFRSTILPALHKTSDFEEMGELIKGAKNFYLQTFRPEITLDKKLSSALPFTKQEMADIKKIFEKYVKNVFIRGSF